MYILMNYSFAFSRVLAASAKEPGRINLMCLAFLSCALSNVSSNGLAERRHSHIGCIYLAFLRCVFSSVSSNRMPDKMHSHTDRIYLTLLHCVFSGVLSNYLV